MQTSTPSATSNPSSVLLGTPADAGQAPKQSAYSAYQIIRRNGAVVSFEPSKIAVALMKAFLAVHGTQGAASASVRETVDQLTEAVVRGLMRSRPAGGTFHIEDVQDQVELGLMRGGHHEVARAYVLYREQRAQERQRTAQPPQDATPVLHVTDGSQRRALDVHSLRALVESACTGLDAAVQAAPIVQETLRNLYDGIAVQDVHKAAILAARTLIEREPGYTYATARLLLHSIVREVLGHEQTHAELAPHYGEQFVEGLRKGVEHRLLDLGLAELNALLGRLRLLAGFFQGLQRELGAALGAAPRFSHVESLEGGAAVLALGFAWLDRERGLVRRFADQGGALEGGGAFQAAPPATSPPRYFIGTGTSSVAQQ